MSFMLNVVMLSVANKPFMLSVFMLNIVMLSVIMLNVLVPGLTLKYETRLESPARGQTMKLFRPIRIYSLKKFYSIGQLSNE